jgi:hypothetical protein
MRGTAGVPVPGIDGLAGEEEEAARGLVTRPSGPGLLGAMADQARARSAPERGTEAVGMGLDQKRIFTREAALHRSCLGVLWRQP